MSKDLTMFRRMVHVVKKGIRSLAAAAVASTILYATSSATITQPSAPITIKVGEAITFQGTSAFDGPSNATTSPFDTYSWTFGDGTTGAGTSTSHAYGASGTYTVTLTATWTYQVCSRPTIDGGCAAYRTVVQTYKATQTITVLAPPTISSFSSSASSALQGGSVTLTWSAANATSLTLSGVGTVTGTNSAVVSPAGTTTYLLTATNAVASATSSVTVSVDPISVSLSPGSASLKLGESLTFAGSAHAANAAVTWSATGGALNGSIYMGTSSGTYTVTATSVADPTKSATASVTVASVSVATPVAVPSYGQCFVGGTVSFSALVSGAANPGVSWTVNGGGSINAAGVFTGSSQGSWTVTATSLQDSTKTASATVQVVPLTVRILQGNTTVKSGQNQVFTASVTGPGTPSQTVAWSVVKSNGGTITQDGIYSAPTNSGDFTVKATSVQDPACSATVRIHVPGWVLRWKKDIVYVGTKEVAEVDSADKTWVTFDDHLGSPRLIWDGTANPMKGTNLIEQKFMPFGESLADPTTALKFAKGFTNHENTDASGLIYMQARFYSPWFGRFLSPDPGNDQHFEDTQKWNIYSYCGNDPTMRIDMNGMEDGAISRFFQGVLYRSVDNATLGHVERVGSTFGNAPQAPSGVAGKLGMLFGDALGFTGGTTATGAGYTGAVATSPTVVGAVAGAAVGTYGVAVTATSIKNTIADVGALMTAANRGGSTQPAEKEPHGNKADDRPATRYEKYDKEGKFEKHGITKHENPSKRYSKKEINGGRVDPVERGPRKEMLKKERDLVERQPGPKNREPWAGKRQGE
jgi:RHS repeat-associated protein